MAALTNTAATISEDDYLAEVKATLEEVYHKAGYNLKVAEEIRKRAFDLKTKPNLYKIGDIVFIYRARTKLGKLRKLHNPFVGPLVITDLQGNDATVRPLDDEQAPEEKIHTDKLSLAYNSLASTFQDQFKLARKTRRVVRGQ